MRLFALQIKCAYLTYWSMGTELVLKEAVYLPYVQDSVIHSFIQQKQKYFPFSHNQACSCPTFF